MTTETTITSARPHRGRSAGGRRVRPATAARVEEIDLGILLRILLRRSLTILIVLALFLGAAYAYLKVTAPTYTATSRVLVEPRQKQVIGTDLDNPRFGVDAAWIESQADVVLSTRTLSKAIEDVGLDTDPDFGGAPDEGLDEAGRAARRARVVADLRESIEVLRADRTYVFEIAVHSTDPEKSARIATAVANAFVSTLIDAKADAIRQANELLSRQLETLRQKSREADEKLETYRREKGILAAEGFLVDEATLRQLNEAYVAAGLAAQRAEERLKRIEAARQAGASRFDSLLDPAASAILSRLNIEYGLAARRLAERERQLGPSHPQLEDTRADVARARALIDEELRSLEGTARLDFEIAQATEQNTREKLDQARDRMSDTGDNLVFLRELESDANIRREIYKAFLSRIEETALQEEVQISDARVLNEAIAPERPSAPKKAVVLGLAGLAGLGLGMSLALYRGRRDVAALFSPVDDPLPPTDPEAIPVAAPRAAPEPDRRPPAPPSPGPAGGPSSIAAVTHAPPPSPAGTPEPPVAPSPPVATIPVAPAPVAPAPVAPAPVAPPPADRSDRLDAFAAAFAAREAARREPADEPAAAEMADWPWPPVALPADFPVPAFARIALPPPVALAGEGADPRRAVGLAVEKRPGVASRPGLAAFRPVFDRLRPAGEGRPALVAVGGATDPMTVAAVAFGLASAAAARRERVLLVDAASGPDRLSSAFFGAGEPGIVEVVAGLVDPEDILSRREAPNLSVLTAASEANAGELDRRAATVAIFMAGLARDFDRTVVCLGANLSAALVHAVADVATDVLFAIEADHAVDRDVMEETRELGTLIPNFSGVILVDRAVAAERALGS